MFYVKNLGPVADIRGYWDTSSWLLASNTCYPQKENNFDNSYHLIPVSCLEHNSRNSSATSSPHFALLLFPKNIIGPAIWSTHTVSHLFLCGSRYAAGLQGYASGPKARLGGFPTLTSRYKEEGALDAW